MRGAANANPCLVGGVRTAFYMINEGVASALSVGGWDSRASGLIGRSITDGVDAPDGI